MFDKFIKNLPLSSYYVGYRVRKDTVLNSEVLGDGLRSDVFIYTYLSDQLFLYIKDDNGYLDEKLKKSCIEVGIRELCSMHVDYANTPLMRSNYDSFSKNNLYGVFGVMSLEYVMDSIMSADSLNAKPEFKYDNEKGLTVLEADIILKQINKYLGGSGESFITPMVLKDELDLYAAEFKTIEEFMAPLEYKNALQVKEILKGMKR